MTPHKTRSIGWRLLSPNLKSLISSLASLIFVATCTEALSKTTYLECGDAVISFNENEKVVLDGTYVKGRDRFTMLGEIRAERVTIEGQPHTLSTERKIYRFDEEIIEWGWKWLPNKHFDHSERTELNRLTGKYSSSYGNRDCRQINSTKKF